MSDKQERANKFYNIDNLITIDVTMPASDWSAVKNASPQGGVCNFSWKGDRYTWYKTTSVTLSGTHFPASPITLQNIGIIKKSFCGSFSNSKPSLRLDYTRFEASNEKPIEKAIGVHNLVFNNCKQDDAYIRQPLGYELCRQAGLPSMRCNFAKVVVNGTDMGVYVNLEPIKKRFAQNNFNDNDKGNCYELELGEDLVVGDIDSGRISFEGFSKYKDFKDLRLAATQIAAGIAGAKNVIDWQSYCKFAAMEALLKHWDGYGANRNNTYLYNDNVAVPDPTIKDVNFKFIMSGIDQILQSGRDYHVAGNSKLGALVRGDKQATAELYSAFRELANTVFSRENHDGVISPMIDRMEALLKSVGVTPGNKITDIRNQVRLIRTAAFQIIGEMPTNASRFMAKDSGDCFRASDDEFVAGSQREVYHEPPTDAPADLWTVTPGTKDKTYRFQNKAYGSWLHADKTVKTKKGSYDVYSFEGGATANDDFTISHDGTRQWHAGGTFKMKSVGLGHSVHFSQSDLTPKGRKQVCQGVATTLFLL